MRRWRAFGFLTRGFALGLGLVLANPAPAADKTLRVAITNLPTAKGNPYATTATTPYLMFTAIFDTLTVIDDKGEVHPWLALAWTPQNPNTWHFKLRPNVVFSNGEPLDAFAVKTTFEFLISPAAVAQSVARDIDFISGARVIDPLTVEIITKTPNILLPRYVSGINIVAPKHFLKVGLEGIAQEPIGTGPFKPQSWGAEKALLAANRTSWRPPKLDYVEILALPDATTRMQAIATKRVDIATNINIDDVPALEAAGNRFHTRNPTRISVMAMDNIKDGTPFKDMRVRQAMNYAVNREAIVKGLLAGMVEPATQPAVPVAVGYVPGLQPYPYDPAKAKALLKEAGVENGFSFLAEMPTGALANDTAVAQQIATDLAVVGIKMEIRTITFPQLVKYMTVGDWKGYALMTDFASAPALDMMRAFNRHSCHWPAPWYCDREIQPAIDAAERSFDLAERNALTQKAVQHYRDTASSIFLYPIVSLDGVAARVTHWQPWNDNFMYHTADVKD
ncbi:MAG: ABC transporter substrate-binding protein [Rhodospirillaceae bacterium]|nr:ABC transporter substrate-binding protein [Rhodospirillaceae bacterium]